MTPARVLRCFTIGLLSLYVAAWAIGWLAWWMVLVYSIVVTVAWAETGNRERYAVQADS